MTATTGTSQQLHGPYLPGEITQTEFARRVGCSRQNISKLVKRDVIPRLANGKLDWWAALAAYEANTDPAHHSRIAREEAAAEGGDVAGAPELPAPAAVIEDEEDVSRETSRNVNDQLKQARAEREQHAAELVRLKLLEKSGELIDAAKVERDAFEMSRALRDRLQGMVERLTPILTAELDERRVSEILTEEIDKELHGVADYGKDLMSRADR